MQFYRLVWIFTKEIIRLQWECRQQCNQYQRDYSFLKFFDDTHIAHYRSKHMLLTLLTAVKVSQEGKEAILCSVINE